MSNGDQLRALAAQLKDADKTLKKELTNGLRRDVKPVTAEVQETVRSSPAQGGSTRSMAARQRAGHGWSRSRALSPEAALARIGRRKRGTVAANLQQAITDEIVKAGKSKMAKATRQSGLRETIARATGASVSAAAESGVNAVWRTKSRYLPPSQKKLPKYWNNGQWRHPVFGNRDRWVTQRGRPYFDVVIRQHSEDLKRTVVAAMEETAKKITEAAG